MQTGLVYTDRGFKTFTDYRRIQRGPRRGMVEVCICRPVQAGVKYVPRVVHPDQIKRYPERRIE